LIDDKGRSSGILSGGCFETNLRDHALAVLKSNRPKRVWFDSRDGGDSVWGLGMGCEGAMDVWLEPLSIVNEFAPMPALLDCWKMRRREHVIMVVGGEALEKELGRHSSVESAEDDLAAVLQSCRSEVPGITHCTYQGRRLEVFVAPVAPPFEVLLCGAGRDAIPVHDFVAALGWSVCVYDHRPAYAAIDNFPQARQIILGRPEELCQRLELRYFDAAVIMSHNLQADTAYLSAVAAAELRYIGLLGPATRRARIVSELGQPLRDIERNLHGPAGLDIGGSGPESIALSIVAQMHAVLCSRTGAPLGGSAHAS
jgi:xanthine/CO dehydrogenase XdhC/CoxF family maturation factor